MKKVLLELDGVPVTKPVVKEKLPIFGARHIREADIVPHFRP